MPGFAASSPGEAWEAAPGASIRVRATRRRRGFVLRHQVKRHHLGQLCESEQQGPAAVQRTPPWRRSWAHCHEDPGGKASLAGASTHFSARWLDSNTASGGMLSSVTRSTAVCKVDLTSVAASSRAAWLTGSGDDGEHIHTTNFGESLDLEQPDARATEQSLNQSGEVQLERQDSNLRHSSHIHCHDDVAIRTVAENYDKRVAPHTKIKFENTADQKPRRGRLRR
ncbi:uncharacterized protein LOC142560193 isoform X1 [Dermacentor variabilis]|uniref:uncharacterized protein LOC142560193 isoform X1 n=1 Tax=Dermacentor variabilis TaxID=34621 RepID=UPI003F5C75FF